MQLVEKEIEVNDLYIPYIEDKSRFLILFGGGGCFTGDTLVNTPRGHKPISEIKEGEFVLSLGKTGERIYKLVDRKFVHGGGLGKNMITFILTNGVSITSTENHEYLIDNEWISAFDIAGRILEGSDRIQFDLLGEQFRKATNSELERKKGHKGNEAILRRIRIFKNHDLQRWEVQNNQDSQVNCSNIYSQSTESTTSQPFRFRQTKQQYRKSGMDFIRAKQKTLLGKWKAWNITWRNYWNEYFKGKSNLRDKIEIQKKSLYEGNASQGIRSESGDDKGYCSSKELETSLIEEIIISEPPKFVYDLSVRDNSNYTVSKENIIVHNSGKSVFACFKICLRTVTEKDHKFLVFRKVANTIKESVFAEIKTMLSDMGVLHEFYINKTDKSFTHKLTGNQIICMGLDEPEKIKSIKGITGMWIEELTEFEETDFDQLNIRIRGEKENYIQIIGCFNPISEDHWAVKRFVTCSKLEENTVVVKSTHLDNHFLSNEDRQQLLNLKERNPLFYDIYCLGIPGVVDKTNKFMFSFNEEKQVKPVTLNPNLPIWATFDFNIDPMTVTIGQRVDQSTLVLKKSIQLDNSDIYQMTDRIKSDYPNAYLIVTGDASGHNRTGAVRGKTSYWQIIKHELSLKDLNMKVRRQNIGLIESRVLCNAVNQAVEIIFDPECKPLINECKFGQVDEHGVLVKDRKKQKNDFLDGFRYLVDANFYDFLGKQNKYKR